MTIYAVTNIDVGGGAGTCFQLTVALLMKGLFTIDDWRAENSVGPTEGSHHCRVRNQT